MRLVLSCLCLAASVGARADEPVRTREVPPAPASAPKAEVESPAPASDLGTLRKLGPSNLVKGKYLFSRGLGDRYSNALLNGVPLPSSDPDRRAIPMGALSPILKSGARLENFYLPDSPADFSGGSLRLRAEDYPKERRLQIELRGSANTQSSFRSNLGYPGGVDYFGIDDGTRALPNAVPGNQALRIGEGNPPMSPEEAAHIGRSFRNVWRARPTQVGMDHGLLVTFGGTESLGVGTLAHYASLSFSKDYRRTVSEIANLSVERGAAVVRERFSEEKGVESTQWGAFAGARWSPSAAHRLSVLGLFTRATTDSAQLQTGLSESLGNLAIENTRLRFITQDLLFTMLEGDHGLRGRSTSVHWQLHYAHTAQDQPDMRDVTYDKPGNAFGLRSIPGSGERFFGALQENSAGAGVDVNIPLGGVVIKAGAFYRFARRAFLARRFWFELTDPAIRFREPELVFTSENIGTNVRVDERTLATDHYDADVQTIAGYVMADVVALGPVRLTGGVRFEYYRQDLLSLNPLVGRPEEAQGARRTDADPMPAIIATWQLRSDMKLWASYSNTVSRPQLREIAPFKFYNFTRQRLDEGNPRLGRAYVYNADLKWAWSKPAYALSAGFFYKHLADPIERVIFDDRRSITYENAGSARVYGGELTASVDLGRLGLLRGLSVAFNGTVSDSRVSLKPEQVRLQTSTERPLQGQAPYLVDMSVTWAPPKTGARFGIHYAAFGERIVDVGSNFLPDVYEQPFHRLDVSYEHAFGGGWKLRVYGGNVLNQPVSLRGGGVTVLRYRPGADAGAALTFQL